MRSYVSMLAVVVFAGSFAAFGCAAPVDEPSNEVASESRSLAVVEADEALGKLVAVYREDGRAVTFEMRLGDVREVPPVDPNEEPSYQVDARVSDQEGRVFHSRLAGDRHIDSTWTAPVIANIDEALRAKDFEIAARAEAAFRELKVSPALEQLRLAGMDTARSIGNLAKGALDKATPPQQAPTVPTDEGTVTTKSNTLWGISSAYYWDYYFGWKDGSIYDHTAVALRGWSSGKSLLSTAESCNHGTCAAAMSRKCTMAGYLADDGTRTRYFYRESSTSTGSRYGGCTTTYVAMSTSGGHNCHDDTRLQEWAIWNDRTGDTTCNQFSSTINAPWCAH